MRVLTAVSPSSQTPILQARGADGSLIITSAPPPNLPPGAHSVVQINPGYMKYGWSSAPQQFAPLHHLQREPATPTVARSFAAAKLALLSGSGRSSDSPENSQGSAQTSELSPGNGKVGQILLAFMSPLSCDCKYEAVSLESAQRKMGKDVCFWTPFRAYSWCCLPIAKHRRMPNLHLCCYRPALNRWPDSHSTLMYPTV